EQAYYFFEKSKAVLLHEAMAENGALNALPDSLRTQDLLLLERVEKARDRLNRQREASTDYAAYVAVREAFNRFRDSLRTTGLLSSIHAEEHLPWQDLFAEGIVDTNQWIIHYFVGNSHTYALVLKPRGLHLVQVGPTTELEDAAQKVLNYFTSSGAIVNDPQGYFTAAYKLYKRIFQPLDLPQGQRLVIIPDGVLTYLPFAALTTAPAFTGSFASGPYVLQRHPVTYAFSGSVLRQQQTLQTKQGVKIMAYAPFGDGTSPTGYPQLSFSNDELSGLRDIAMDLRRDSAAQLQRFLAEVSGYRVVHLSTHAFSSPQEQSPHIAFYDSLLYLQDVYRLPLAADLIVLSACQTNIGHNAPGEGTLGLGRGFTQAGTRGIISSLWNVNATSTGRVLGSFYDQVAEQTEVGLALHEAKIEYLSDPALADLQKSPYYWAGLTYYGLGQSLDLPRPTGKGWWLLAIPLVLLIGLFWWRSRTRT
ncbi:MAG: CHAT domain-containing protein, partial [Bacteroidota bacterium]